MTSSEIITILALGSGIFILVNKIFDFLDWYFKGEKDSTHKEFLFWVWDILEKNSYFGLFFKVLESFCNRLSIFLRKKYKSGLKVIIITALFVSIGILVSAGVTTLFESVSAFFAGFAVALIFFIPGIFVGFFALISLWITYFLIKRAVHSKSSITLSIHLGIDALIGFTSGIWSSFFVLSVIYPIVKLFSFLAKTAERAKMLEEMNFIGFVKLIYGPIGQEVVAQDPEVAIKAFIFMSVAGAFPTVFYLLLILFAFLLKLLPNSTKDFLERVFALMTLEDKSVIKQIGIVFSFFSTVLTVIVLAIKYMSS